MQIARFNVASTGTDAQRQLDKDVNQASIGFFNAVVASPHKGGSFGPVQASLMRLVFASHARATVETEPAESDEAVAWAEFARAGIGRAVRPRNILGERRPTSIFAPGQEALQRETYEEMRTHLQFNGSFDQSPERPFGERVLAGEIELVQFVTLSPN